VMVPPKRVPYFKPGKKRRSSSTRRRHRPPLRLPRLRRAAGRADARRHPARRRFEARMEILYTPWRMSYLTGEGVKPSDGCLFCDIPSKGDAEALILYRGARVYALLNRFPYSSGHLMVTPYATARPSGRWRRTSGGSSWTSPRARSLPLRPPIRRTASTSASTSAGAPGAGIPGHAHLHVVPRWTGTRTS